jgi:uncharacterized membrane protein YsdA (DUF1294 family)
MTKRSHQQTRKSRISISALVLLAALLTLPSLAILRLTKSFDPRLLLGYVVAISAITFGLYWHDKRRAVAGGRRTPEFTLHVAELLGGWPAAFLAQRILRHKIAKPRYQVVFWVIVGLYEVASIAFLYGWNY